MGAALYEVVEVEGFALDDEAALEGVAAAEAGVLGGEDAEGEVAQILHVADAVGEPGEAEAVAGGECGGYAEAAAHDGAALLVGREG